MGKATFFLHDVTEKDFEILAEIIRNKGGFNCSLKGKDDYENYYCYVEETINELLKYGSNTLGPKEKYYDVLKKVCNKLNVSYHTDEDMGRSLLEKVMNSVFDNWSSEQKKGFIDTVLKDEKDREKFYREGEYFDFRSWFRAGGFTSYILAAIIANSISTSVLGRGLSIAAKVAFTRALTFLSGPLALLAAVWTVKEVAGPAYRVIVPAVIYIEALRVMQTAGENGVEKSESEENKGFILL